MAPDAVAGRLLVAVAGALVARQALRAVAARGPGERLIRTNYRGRPVSLAGGPALAFGASTAAALGARSAPVAAAALVAGLGAGAVGGYDDMVGGRPEQKTAKGFRGHLAALADGRVTSGLVKIAGVGASGVIAAALLESARITRTTTAASGRTRRHAASGPASSRKMWRSGLDVLLGAGVIAGMANLVNLLDLRPGRAIKASLLFGLPVALRGGAAGGVAAGAAGVAAGAAGVAAGAAGVAAGAAGVAAGAVGAAGGLLASDLDEQIMLGDAGANALGALLGTAFAARTGTRGRAALLAVVVGLTAASEKVSFTQVIQRTPVLRELDALGRRAD